MTRENDIERGRRLAREAEECGMRAPRGGPVPGDSGAEEVGFSAAAGTPPLDFARFRAQRVRGQLRALLDDLLVAIEQRDLQAVWEVLDDAQAERCLPPAVREEALVLARLPRGSHRAPIHLFRFSEQLRRLDDEPLEWSDPDQLDLGLAARSARGLRPAASRRRRSGST